jgi:peptide-methionine (S)-S-oxide reductase
MEHAILGGGCFWCVEAVIQRLKGVVKVVPGYCGGKIINPVYKQVKTGDTGHIEVVKVDFNPKIINY